MNLLTSFSSMTALSQPETSLDRLKEKHRIGIFGGTFNPIHNGQLIAAEQVCTQLGLDRVYFMPDAVPFGGTHENAVEPSTRSEMIRLAIRGNSKFDIELTPIHDGGQQSTYSVLKKLTTAHPENDYYLIMGAHLIRQISSWDQVSSLTKLVHLVAIEEPGVARNSDFQAIWVYVNWLNISSSDIRSRLRTRQSVRYLIPDVVAAYIAEYGLYQGRFL
ncbi:nicotinate-nucleotide adenylyltransferase [Oenococcus kitaharae]|uniref:Probable nicotinate-nucleotide adenylyltransferase n=1 Tax=Oenococcus kitaharae DSM 17330 TaxID=1045004 RepID=G9WG42_9LACO|nr:Nicotinate-nucleotide adenylyltransferase [Oenococcus kitaharae DSM 17330]OEY83464.1 nicotinate-nucleotide adenylyltransferase [Oenococcus kitaharae]OEY85263.1 nicotinate-nucleotide adenylyltransferase [Oenococcus kitaharae]OEY86117.1 nicotinate-nucleotide adenylyltransferase [Oenococcus kitaharae]